MPILAGTSPVTPLVVLEAVASWEGFGVTWTGPDGTVFDLVSPEAGTVVTPDGIRGLNMPKFDRYTTVSPALAGSQWRGSRTQERSVFWPIFVYGGSTDEFLRRDRAFWASLRPDLPGTWAITTPNGASRSLRCRFDNDNDQAFGLDPAKLGWASYGVSLVADDLPYWSGPQIDRTFGLPNAQPFFMTSGGVLRISPGQTTDSATIPNPGDVPAWPVWTVTGPFSGATLGAGGGSLVLPALSSGVTWTIDTRPDRQTAVDGGGTDHSGAVTWNPLPVPSGSQVALSIALTAASSPASVACSLTPLYFRAW